MNTNTFILWVSIHEYHRILFVTSILQDQDYDLDKTYSNQIINLKFIIKSLKLISRFTKYHEIINLDQMGKAFFLRDSFSSKHALVFICQIKISMKVQDIRQRNLVLWNIWYQGSWFIRKDIVQRATWNIIIKITF